jgi:predicted RNase H-like nuclease
MYVGVDGCKAGWLALADVGDDIEVHVHPTFGDLLQRWGGAYKIFVDIPIGLPSAAMPSRACDQQARKAIGPRASSVFSSPSRPAAHAASYPEAQRLNIKTVGRSLSAQAWGICKKIAEVDRLMVADAEARARVLEVHPEVCFWAFAGGQPMQHPKKTVAGQAERLALLERLDPRITPVFDKTMQKYRRREVQADDILDAMVALITAREGQGQLASLPAEPPVDEAGLPMRMMYRRL